MRNLMVVAAAMIVLAIAATPAVVRGQDFTLDNTASEALTNYLRQNRLPLVGAQIGKASTGARRLVLYGYVATQTGKSDAESKAIAYLGAPRPDVVDRIVIQPEIANMKSGGHAGTSGSGGGSPDNSPSGDVADYAGTAGSGPGGAFPAESIDQVLQDIQRYGVKGAPEEPAIP